ncbi:MAG: Ig-like domain-containing protein [Deltaproteobacteria bacterium]|nr:Ig-like domain-containing protein [Deltaproteobacteria bacterium]
MKKLLVTAIVMTGLSIGSGCSKSEKKTEKTHEKKIVRKVIPPVSQVKGKSTTKKGLIFLLENGSGAFDSSNANQYIPGKPLSETETKNLLKKIPGKIDSTDLKKAFAFRSRTLPAPRPGKTIETPFPPDAVKEKPDIKSGSQKLTVLRATPATDVYIAPNIGVTFSLPMIPVTSHDEAVSKIPVKISPDIKGKWRWMGTKTLVFESELKRLPKSTNYKITIPAGIKSDSGKTLEKEYSWEFSTPTLNVESFYPESGPHNLSPVFYIRFDQRINPDAVIKTMKMEAINGTYVPIRIATEQEIKSDKNVSDLVNNSKKEYKNRFFAFKPVQSLVPAMTYNIKIGPGTPSEEGPAKTKNYAVHSMYTYKPLSISWRNCKSGYKCRPPYSMNLQFNNNLDEKSFSPDMVKVTPDFPKMSITAVGRSIIISGTIRGQQNYTVEVSEKLKDIYNQTLGNQEKRVFHYREAYPSLQSNYKTLSVADPSGKPEIKFHSLNIPKIKVKLFKVKPEDYKVYLEYSRKYRYDPSPPPHPGKAVFEKIYSYDGKSDEMVETIVSVGKFLNSSMHGHLVVQVSQDPVPDKRYRWKTFIAWIQFTNLGIDAHLDNTKLLGLVTSLKTGKAISGASVRILAGPSGSTDKSGLVSIDLPQKIDSPLGSVLVASTAEDVAMLPKSMYSYWGRYGKFVSSTSPGNVMKFFTFDDRKLYKPKETVNIKGYMRIAGMGADASLTLPKGVNQISFKVMDPRNNKIAEGSTGVNLLGGFNFKFTLPDNANLGNSTVIIKDNAGNTHSHYFKTAEFRKPEFEVSIKSSEGPFILGGTADLTLSADYFSGGGLPGAEVNWSASASTGYFSPAGHGDWSFGDSSMRWWWYSYSSSNSTYKNLTGITDSRGKHNVKLTFKNADPTVPYTVSVNSTVMDVNRQSWTSRKSLIVHPSSLYVGLKTERFFINKGKPLNVKAITVDIDGKTVPSTDVLITCEKEEWKYQKGKYRKVNTSREECKTRSGKDGEAKCEFKPEEGGSYIISARVKDSAGRENLTKITRWVSGGGLPPVRKVDREKLQLISDKKSYEPGDTAEIFIQSPFYPATGVWFTKHAGIKKVTPFKMDSPTHVIKIPLSEYHMPGTEVQVEITGTSPRLDDSGKALPKLPARPAYAGGTLRLGVSLKSRILNLKITPQDSMLKPGGKTAIKLNVTDYKGKPVKNSEIALVAVDESVLALTGYKLSNPIGIFYPSRIRSILSIYLRSQIQLEDPLKLSRELLDADNAIQTQTLKSFSVGNGPAGAKFDKAPPRPRKSASKGMRRKEKRKAELSKGDMEEQSDESSNDNSEAVKMRSNFNALALFAPEVTTDDSGNATVELALPDNLTRYRLMAVAVSGADKYGNAEKQVVARLPIQVRPSPPRFLNFGDEMELPVVVHNQTLKEQQVSVAIRGSNIKWRGPQGMKITIPPQDRRELRFSASTDMPGKAKFNVVASSAEGQDAASFEFPVWTPATTEGFATYGTVDKGAVSQNIKVPRNVVMEFGGLNIQTSSTQLQALTDAVLYLYSYPYECAEQLSSRILSIAALKDVLKAFQTSGLPDDEKIKAAVNRDLGKLRNMQNYDGGFGFWIRGQESWPFLTIHVAHALLRAKEKGYSVNSSMMSKALNYLKYIERHIPSHYPLWVRRSLVAHSLFVRNLAGDNDLDKAVELYPHFADKKQPYMEGIGWIYPVFIKAKDTNHLGKIRKLLLNRVSETAGMANFITHASDGAYLILHSSRRVDALILSGLMLDQPKSDLIPKLVAGLLAHKKKGRWTNTQESVWVLLAMDQYFAKYENVTPNFVSRVWLGNQYAGEHKFKGRTTERHLIKIPMLSIGKPGSVKNLLLQKTGQGRLYYRIGMDYALSDLRPPAADHGFTLKREYLAVSDKDQVKKRPDGTWEIKAGSRVRVKLTMVAPSRRYHVALVDPLPAGLEPENASLLGAPPSSMNKSGSSYGKRGRYGRRSYRWWWRMWGRWHEHHNIRDERVEAFTSLLYAGIHTFEYTARATTPGKFVVPPLKAEEMYSPETFGRSRGDKVIVIP